MKRIFTALVLLPLALAAIFLLSGWWFLLFVLLVVELAVWEYVSLGSKLANSAAMHSLLVLVPIAVLCLETDLLLGRALTISDAISFGALIMVGSAVLTLALCREPEAAVPTLGLVSFGIAYFAVPVTALVTLHTLDPWYVVLAVAIVWAGDSAAYYVGTRWGRHLLAPRVSPKKTWEGAFGGLISAVAVGAVWSIWRIGSVDGLLLAAAAAASAAGQIGDLVESMLKRRAGVKDSGALLPGHGGMLDRLDSLVFAVPVFLLSLRFLGGEMP